VTIPPLDGRRARSRGAARRAHALVVGDVMVDRFIVGGLSRISREADRGKGRG
jgi:bifunctional ADP-heptose synthase (sugar kinase/adenylyltransferase)